MDAQVAERLQRRSCRFNVIHKGRLSDLDFQALRAKAGLSQNHKDTLRQPAILQLLRCDVDGKPEMTGPVLRI